jgi:hypothetical protein
LTARRSGEMSNMLAKVKRTRASSSAGSTWRSAVSANRLPSSPRPAASREIARRAAGNERLVAVEKSVKERVELDSAMRLATPRPTRNERSTAIDAHSSSIRVLPSPALPSTMMTEPTPERTWSRRAPIAASSSLRHAPDYPRCFLLSGASHREFTSGSPRVTWAAMTPDGSAGSGLGVNISLVRAMPR